jgi:hypothetical protein
MRTLAFAMIDGCAVAVFGRVTAQPADFEAYVKFILEDFLVLPRQRLLILSHGATLTNDQRRRVEQFTAATAHRRRIALLTASTFVRGYVKALSVFDPSYRVFDLPALDAALRHLEVPEGSWPDVKAAVKRLSAEVGVEQKG